MPSPTENDAETVNGMIEYGSEFIPANGESGSTEYQQPQSQAGPSSKYTTISNEGGPGTEVETIEEEGGEAVEEPNETLTSADAGPSTKKNKKKKSKGKASAVAQKLKNSFSGVANPGTVSLEKKLGQDGHQLVVDRVSLVGQFFCLDTIWLTFFSSYMLDSS